MADNTQTQAQTPVTETNVVSPTLVAATPHQDAETLQAVKDAAAVIETDTVTVDEPEACGLLAYLTGPGMNIDVSQIDFENSELNLEDGNLRVTLPNDCGEILLLDFAAATTQDAPRIILSENNTVGADVLMTAIAQASRLAEDIQPAAGPDAGTQAGQPISDGNGLSYNPAGADAGFGIDPTVISDVIGPFTIGPAFDEILEPLFPNEPSALPTTPPPFVDTLPQANNDVATTPCGQAVTINVLANDTNGGDGEIISITQIFAQPTNGTVAIVNGQIVYTPNAGFVGDDFFQYEITDQSGNLSVAQVKVTVTNNAPDALNDNTTTAFNTPVTIDVIANDFDPDGHPLTITSTTQGANGTVTIVNNQVVYTPNAGFVGTDTFTYTIDDGCGGTDTATVTVTVGAAPNNPPVALDDTATVVCGNQSAVTIDVLANDSDPDGDIFIITNATDGSHGTVAFFNGQIVYVPNPGFVGTDKFTYTISDFNGGSDTATVTVTVTNENPDAIDDTTTTAFNTPVTIDVLANDSDPDGHPIDIQSFGQGSNGTVTLVNGQLVYTPNAGFVGTDTFTYTIDDGCGGTDTATVTVTVGAAPNNPPVANDDTATTVCGTAVTILPLANDTDPDGDNLLITNTTQGSNGTVQFLNNQQLVYTPNAGFVGTDTFTYTISDGNGGFSTATITVTVTNNAPDAVNDTATTAFQTPVTINVLANDSDPDGHPIDIQSFGQGSNGTVTLVNGQLVYTPNAGFSGTDTFTYTIDDGCGGTDTATVTVTVGAAPNTPPVANNDSATTLCGQAVTINVLANDTDADNDTLTVTNISTPANGTAALVNGQIVYTPNISFVGTDTFTYTISDGNGGTSTATVTVEVTNQPPSAVNDAATTAFQTPVTVDVLANDTDPDGDPLVIKSFGQGSNGTVTLVNGQLVYTPNAGFSGTDSFVYTICDPCGATSTATVTVTVGARPNNNPDAVNDTATTLCGQAATISVLANDTDPDNDMLNITTFTQGANGTVTQVGDQLVYTPNAGFVGIDTFTYTISDGNGGFDTATVTVDVTNQAPDAVDDDRITLQQGTQTAINVLANDSDPDGHTITIQSFTQPANGSVTLVNGQLVYTAPANFTGVTTFTYTIVDPCGATDTATVTITVLPTVTVPIIDCPLVLDLDGNGLNLIPLAESQARFDLDGDGHAQRTAWAGPNEGILAMDRNGNGTIDDINEVYGNGQMDGFSELSLLEDTNLDGIVDANDENWADLRIWIDADSDGVSDEGELFTLEDLGIAGIYTGSEYSGEFVNGQWVSHEGGFIWADGTEGDAYSVWYENEGEQQDVPVEEQLTVVTEEDVLQDENPIEVSAFAQDVFTSESLHGGLDATGSNAADVLSHVGLDVQDPNSPA